MGVSLIAELLFFLLAIFFAFYLPGKFLTIKLKFKLTFLEDLFFVPLLGMMLFTLATYLFSWLRVWYLVVPLFFLLDILALRTKKWKPSPLGKNERWPFLLILILSAIFSLSMVLTGVRGEAITYRRDDLWHLALINELRAHFPPDNPGFAGVPLRGYHYFYNFLLAKMSQLFYLSPFSLYFHFFPLLVALLWGLGVYILMLKWSQKKNVALWALFLSFFGGSFSFILVLRGNPWLSMDDAFGITQPASSLVNPPFAISVVIIIGTLFALFNFLKTRKASWLVPIVLFAGLVTMFKVYAGMILLGGLAILTAMELLKKRFLLLSALLVIGALFLGTYWVLADRSARLLYYPLWSPHKVLIDHLPWYGYGEKYYTYSKLSVISGLIRIEIYGLYVFLIGSLGTRIIGLLALPLLFLRKKKRPSLFTITLAVMTAISILIPLFFIQTGKVFEIIQMAWYFLFFCSLFAAFGLGALTSFKYNRLFKALLVIVIVLVTLPSAYEKYLNYWNITRQREKLSGPYFSAMEFIRSQGTYDDTILEVPKRDVGSTEKALLSWYDSSSPAIVAFANKRSYLNNEYIEFPGVDVYPRISLLKKILILDKTSPSTLEYQNLEEEIIKRLKNDKIVFIYCPHSLGPFDKIENIHRVYENEAATVYRVDEE